MRNMYNFYCIIICVFFPVIAVAQSNANQFLQSGPMPGYSEMRESMIWVQTIQEAEVYAIYIDLANPAIIRYTNKVKTRKDEAFTARLIADTVEPGHRYSYKLYIDNKQVILPYSNPPFRSNRLI